jgi:hypothetical protein
LELSKYGGGGWHSFAIVPEGRDGSGWGNCLSQMSCLEKYYEKRGAGGNRIEEKSGEVPVLPWTVEHGWRSYAEVLERKGQSHMIERLQVGHYGHFQKTNSEEYVKSWKGGGTISCQRLCSASWSCCFEENCCGRCF